MDKPRAGHMFVKWHYRKTKEIPENWSVFPLGKLCNIRKKGETESNLYIGLEHMGQGNNRLEGSGDVKEFTSSKNVFHQGDVLYGKLRPLLNKVWLAEESGYCSTDILPLIPTDLIISKVLSLVISNHDFYWYAVGMSAGTKMPRTNWQDMKKFLVILPPYPEQQKIATILSNIDSLIEQTQQTIDQTQKLRKGLMQRLLTKGIGHSKFKKVKNFFKKEILIPEEWSYPKFSIVIKVNPPTKIDEERCPYIPMDAVDVDKPNFNYFEEREIKSNSGLKKFQEDDVLFARITPSTENGKTCIVENFKRKGIVSSELTVLRPTEKVIPRYLYYYVKSHRIRQFAISQMMGTTGRQRVPDYVFKKDLNFELPGIPEQNNIVLILSKVELNIQHLQSKKFNLETLKKGLMQKILTGQVRVKV
jgi:restriction endonuclease S subunit